MGLIAFVRPAGRDEPHRLWIRVPNRSGREETYKPPLGARLFDSYFHLPVTRLELNAELLPNLRFPPSERDSIGLLVRSVASITDTQPSV